VPAQQRPGIWPAKRLVYYSHVQYILLWLALGSWASVARRDHAAASFGQVARARRALDVRTLEDTMGCGTTTGHVCWSSYRAKTWTGLGTYCLCVYAVPCVSACADGNDCSCDARMSFTLTDWRRDHDKYAASLS